MRIRCSALLAGPLRRPLSSHPRPKASLSESDTLLNASAHPTIHQGPEGRLTIHNTPVPVITPKDVDSCLPPSVDPMVRTPRLSTVYYTVAARQPTIRTVCHPSTHTADTPSAMNTMAQSAALFVRGCASNRQACEPCTRLGSPTTARSSLLPHSSPRLCVVRCVVHVLLAPTGALSTVSRALLSRWVCIAVWYR